MVQKEIEKKCQGKKCKQICFPLPVQNCFSSICIECEILNRSRCEEKQTNVSA